MTADALLNLAMTANTYTDDDGNTFIATASSLQDSTRQPYKAFDNAGIGEYDCWHPKSGVPQWLELQIPTRAKILGFTLKNRSGNVEHPTAITFQGSNDDTNWTNITNISWSDTGSNLTKDVAIESSAYSEGYTYFRWYITAVTSSPYGVIAAITFTDVQVGNIEYLLKSGDSYYTITSTTTTDDDGNETTEKTLTELTDVTELTAETFNTYGLDDIPEWSDYSSLENPTVLCWSEDEAQEMTATVTGTPYPQTIISRPVELIDSTVLGIDSISATASTDALFAFSFDSGTTWEVYLTDTTAWSTVSENSGITATALDEIGSDIWTAKIKDSDGNKIDSFLIRVVLPSTSAYFTNMTVTFLN